MPSSVESLVRNVSTRGGRRKSGLTVLEGYRLVEDALEGAAEFHGVLVTPEFGHSSPGADLLARLAGHGITVDSVGLRSFERLSTTETPQGVMAVVRVPDWSLDDIGQTSPRVVALDAVQDPGNVGALIRTSFALGTSGVLLLPGTAGLHNPKVVRGSMGAVFRHPVVSTSVSDLEAWCRDGAIEIWAADRDGKPLRRMSPPDSVCLVVGNEGAGLSPEIKSMAGERVAVSLARGAESLNVAVAAGIILHWLVHGG